MPYPFRLSIIFCSMNKTIATLLLAFAVITCNAQARALDNTFGSGGKITTSLGHDYDVGLSTVMQPDGKILVAGYTGDNVFGGDADFAVVRYHTNGTLDNSFGTGGKVTTPVGNEGDCGRSVALQSDCKILVG